MKLFSILFFVFSLSGCVGNGDLYHQVLKKQAVVDQTKGRLIFYRTTETMAAAGMSARVTVDNENLRYVSYGGFTIFDVVPGPHNLNVYLGEEGNRCEMHVAVAPNEELFFELKPNRDLILGNAIAAGGAALTSATIGGGYGGPGAVHREGASNCRSYFSMTRILREQALKQLESLGESPQ